MIIMILFCIQALALLVGWLPLAAGHAALWHPSMWGFNVTFDTFPYDNRPLAPLYNYTFEQWWFHGHLGYPPNPGDVFTLPAGQSVTTEIACTKAATSFYNTSDGGDIREGDDPCPRSNPAAYHTTGISDVKGCALAIAYKADVNDVQPEDFSVFSVNQTCVWNRFTEFEVPARMPPCPPGGCTCAWFWIHSPDSGSEQNYMVGFKCDVVGSTSMSPIAKSQVARRCGPDPANNITEGNPGNCTYGAKQPLYWLQAERNNMFEDYYAPPFYNDLYNFKDGAQDDIFVDSYAEIPAPTPGSTDVPTPISYTIASSTTSNAPSISIASAPPIPSSANSTISATSATPSVSMPSTTPQSKAKICKLSRTPKLYSNVELHRRSFFHSFLARSKKRHAGKRFSLWYPFRQS